MHLDPVGQLPGKQERARVLPVDSTGVTWLDGLEAVGLDWNHWSPNGPAGPQRTRSAGGHDCHHQRRGQNGTRAEQHAQRPHHDHRGEHLGRDRVADDTETASPRPVHSV